MNENNNNNSLKPKKPKSTKTKAIKKIDTETEIIDNVEVEVEDKKKDEVVVVDNDLSKEISLLRQKPIANVEEEKKEEEIVVVEEVSLKKKKKEHENKKNIVRYLDTPILEGLSTEIVEKRRSDGLINVNSDNKGKTVLQIILSNLFTFFNMLYATITVIFILLGSYENLLFLVTIIPNLIIGVVQEVKAKMMIDKLKLMSAPTTTVVRDGQKLEIAVEEVVLDDIILFTSGKQISADCIVVDGFAEVNESLLTGESDAITKKVGDQLLSGSYVVSGTVVARADKVGKENYIEKLSKDAKIYRKPKSELLRTLNGIIKIVSIIILPLAIATYITSSVDAPADFLGLNRDGLIKSASSILAMIPAGLFLLTSVALFVSVIRLAKHKTLVQELYCIEMLARVNVLCLDKTGTITDGTMRVTDCIELKNHTEFTIREIIGSMMNTFTDVNPTSEALIKFFDKNKILTPTEKIPFSSKRKYSAVTFGEHGTFVLGAPEFVLSDNYDKVASKVDRFASEGCRVLILGQTNNKVKPDELPKNIKPICLISLQDHIRDDAIDTIDYFKQNGVDIKVISGDNPVTVSEIALRAGVEGAERYISLAGLTDEEVRESVFEYNVFGRVSPEQKRILVKALKEHKKTVAMTGDGVNDILALKEADCSIAMASGSEATRYVSHLVLMDSNFSSMPKVVQEGRRVINNIQKTSTLFLVKTTFSILLAVLYIILGMQAGSIKMSYPFAAKHLYMIEWFAIGIPAAFLALQQNREMVKGKFLPNVIKSTLPGAITIVVLHVLLNLIRIIPGFQDLHDNQEVFTTIATVVTTFVMLVALYNVSLPMNLSRKFIYFGMVLLCLLAGLDLIPFMKLDLSYRRSVEEYNIDTNINSEGFWTIEGIPTPARAFKNPNINNLNGDEYVVPVLSVSRNEKWILNGFESDVTVRDDEVIELEVVGKYWNINGNPTKAKAVKQPEIVYNFDINKYETPQLKIDKGYWTLDGVSTKITAYNVSKLSLDTNHLGYWEINGEVSTVRATEKVLNNNEYIIPNITIYTEGELRYFKVNERKTNILVNDANEISLEVIDSYWNLNGFDTSEKAQRISETTSSDDEYVSPTLEIGRNGKWTVNGWGTDEEAKDNLLIIEILITILLVLIADPLIKFISLLLKKFKLTSNY